MDEKENALIAFYERHGKDIDLLVSAKADKFAAAGDRRSLEMLAVQLAGMVFLLNSRLERIPIVTEFHALDYLRMN